jgi:hypothetical protein
MRRFFVAVLAVACVAGFLPPFLHAMRATVIGAMRRLPRAWR